MLRHKKCRMSDFCASLKNMAPVCFCVPTGTRHLDSCVSTYVRVFCFSNVKNKMPISVPYESASEHKGAGRRVEGLCGGVIELFYSADGQFENVFKAKIIS